jgi:alkylation response protein AidB-like acyl-CoA dehydrogenase
MDAYMTVEHQKLQEVCRRLAADFATRSAQHDRDTSLPVENYEALKREGLYGLTIPKELGGWGAGVLGWVVAVEELAQGCPSTALTFNMHAAGISFLMETATIIPAAKQRLATLAVKEQKLFAAAFSEPGGSSLIPGPTFTPSVRARRVDGGYALRGRKAFLSMVEACDYLMLMVHPEDSPNPSEMMMLIGPYPAPGLRVENVWDTLGMRGTRSNNLILDEYFVPEQNFCFRVDNVGEWLLSINHWGVAYGTVYIGIAAAAYRYACEVLKQRVPRGFAQPLSYHPQIRTRIAEMSVDLEAARLLMRHAAWMADTEGLTPATQSALFRAKYFSGEAAARITRSALTACGAHALFKTSPLEQLFRDGASAPIMPPSGDACLDALGLFELGLEPAEMLPPLKVAG